MDTVAPAAGRSTDFAATLLLAGGGRVFCKGARAEGDAAGMHRREAHVNAGIHTVFTPRLLWHVKADGWHVLGFEHVAGRHADLAPGSADLPIIATMLSGLARDLTPSPATGVQGLCEKWTRVQAWQQMREDPPAGLDEWTRSHLDRFAALESVAGELVAGDTLVHTDVHEGNLLIDPRPGGTTCLVDWSWAHVAAPWVDTAFLVIRLIQHGHRPAEAEAWAATTERWRAAPPAAVDAFATEIYGMWEHLRHLDPRPIRHAPTRAARTWAMYRMGLRDQTSTNSRQHTVVAGPQGSCGGVRPCCHSSRNTNASEAPTASRCARKS